MDIFTEREKVTILECLKASIGEEFFPDWEFHTLTGYEKDDVKNMINHWPNVNLREHDSRDLVLNIINNLLGYPHNASKGQWHKFITVTPNELDKLWVKINGEPEKGGTDKYFSRLR